MEQNDLLDETYSAFMSQIPGICLLKSTIRKELKDRVPLQLRVTCAKRRGKKKNTKKCWLVSVN